MGSDFRIGSDGCLMFKDRICVPKNEELIQKILQEAHSGYFSIHPGSTKMYNDLKKMHWWNGMKRDISEFVSKCLICQQVKAEHQVPSGLLQPIMVPEWKWDRITMDFILGLPLTPRKKNAIWAIVDRLTKSLILFRYVQIILLISWLNCISERLLDFMGYLCQSFRIEIRGLPHGFGKSCKRH